MTVQKEARKSLILETILPEPGDILRVDQKKVFEHYCGIIRQFLILKNLSTPKICLEGKHKRKLSLDVIKELTLQLRMTIAGMENEGKSDAAGYRKNELLRDRRDFEKYKSNKKAYFFQVI